MPTPEEIKSIAQKYVKEEHYDDFFLNEATKVIHWLSKTYCIVPKSRIAEMYAEFRLNVFRSYSEPATILVKACTVDVAKVNLLEYLFGKELFNEEKE